MLSADVIYALVSGIHRLAVCHTTCCHGYCIRLPNLENHNVYVYQLLQVHRQRILNNKFLVYILCDKHFLPRPPSNCAMCKVRPRIAKMAGQESQRWPAQVYTDQARNHSTAMFAGRYDTVSTEGSGLCRGGCGLILGSANAAATCYHQTMVLSIIIARTLLYISSMCIS